MSFLTDLRAAHTALLDTKANNYYPQWVAFMNLMLSAIENIAQMLVDPLHATSTTEITMGAGTHLMNVGTGKKPQLYDRCKIAHDANNIMYAYLQAYDEETGDAEFLVNELTDVIGAGTYDEWLISFIVGDEGTPGAEYWNAPRKVIATDNSGLRTTSDKELIACNTAGHASSIALSAHSACTRVKLSDIGGLAKDRKVTWQPPAGHQVAGHNVDEAIELDWNYFRVELHMYEPTKWGIF